MEPTDARQKARAVYHHTQGRALGSTFLETESLRQFFLTDIEDESKYSHRKLWTRCNLNMKTQMGCG